MYKGELIDRAKQLLLDLKSRALFDRYGVMSEIVFFCQTGGDIRRHSFPADFDGAIRAIYHAEQELLKCLAVCVNCQYEVDPADCYNFAYGNTPAAWGKAVEARNYMSSIVDDVTLTLVNVCRGPIEA